MPGSTIWATRGARMDISRDSASFAGRHVVVPLHSSGIHEQIVRMASLAKLPLGATPWAAASAPSTTVEVRAADIDASADASAASRGHHVSSSASQTTHGPCLLRVNCTACRACVLIVAVIFVVAVLAAVAMMAATPVTRELGGDRGDDTHGYSSMGAWPVVCA